ncbi:chromatin assembly factor 1 subunit A [Elysia marginata]|uniref:Chromatin assembly factor 1 subunit A n=1 Tax=Elysia marginata TaxID=1093978 RepID=A0AAV4IJZ0_9GAST|nr:chromatin assembly factor 1 subunit A [Elysia marginata]
MGATLSFLKASPKLNPKEPTQSKKRKNSSPAPDSPNKTAKLSKPLVIVIDPPNSPSKQPKATRSSNAPEPIINDHEVSSSSEADSGSSKSGGGKCSFMERFVCKLPKEGNHEISSTNDVDKRVVEEKDKSQEAEVDCMILDNCDNNKADKTNEGKKEPEVINKDDEEKKETDPAQKDTSLNEEDTSITMEEISAEPDMQIEKSANESLLISGTDTLNEGDASATENLDASLNESSFLSGTDLVSTPCKEKDVSCNTTPQSTPTNSSTSKTPASKKKGPKIDLEKRAEKEAQKQKLKEEREQNRLEKKRKLEEEKAEKERIKKEKKEARDKERQLQQEKLQKEKEEKERVKEIERQKKEEEKKKKEEERLQKEEERKKKQEALEAKQEEKRQKEEEKRQKEEEKKREEEEKKKKAEKAKLAFQSFFIKPKENMEKPPVAKPNQGQFVPFQVKKDMHLAPATRREALSDDTKLSVDQVLENPSMLKTTYLKELKSGQAKPHKTGRILRTNPQPSEDIEVVHDPEALKKVIHKVKLLQFHTDYRPPYYGTWSKVPKLSPRNPWKKDEKMFDYEVDSDDEWEEEEPGESLSCSDGEEDKGEKGEEDENDEEEDGWMVPHGYLSEDEGCNEDDEPLDQGVIQAVKLRYRKAQFRPMMTEMEADVSKTGSELMHQVLILNALLWIAEAWKEVNPSTITKCFHKAGFSPSNDLTADEKIDIPEELNTLSLTIVGVNFAELPTIDADINICDTEEVDWSKSATDLLINSSVKEDENSEEEDEADREENCERITLQEAFSDFNKCRNFFQQRNSAALQYMSAVEGELW